MSVLRFTSQFIILFFNTVVYYTYKVERIYTLIDSKLYAYECSDYAKFAGG